MAWAQPPKRPRGFPECLCTHWTRGVVSLVRCQQTHRPDSGPSQRSSNQDASEPTGVHPRRLVTVEADRRSRGRLPCG